MIEIEEKIGGVKISYVKVNTNESDVAIIAFDLNLEHDYLDHIVRVYAHSGDNLVDSNIAENFTEWTSFSVNTE